MVAGRPRKTVAELKRDGTYREDRHGSRADAQFEGGEPVVGVANKGHIAEQLRQVVIDSYPDGALTPMDGYALDGMADIYERWLDLANGTDDKLRARLWDQFIGCAARFGLTPADRAKLNIEKPEDNSANPIDALLAARGGGN